MLWHIVQQAFLVLSCCISRQIVLNNGSTQEGVRLLFMPILLACMSFATLICMLHPSWFACSSSEFRGSSHYTPPHTTPPRPLPILVHLSTSSLRSPCSCCVAAGVRSRDDLTLSRQVPRPSPILHKNGPAAVPWFGSLPAPGSGPLLGNPVWAGGCPLGFAQSAKHGRCIGARPCRPL
jgi:hypothetical protein